MPYRSGIRSVDVRIGLPRYSVSYGTETSQKTHRFHLLASFASLLSGGLGFRHTELQEECSVEHGACGLSCALLQPALIVMRGTASSQ